MVPVKARLRLGVAVVKNQKVMFEIGGVSEEVAKEASVSTQHTSCSITICIIKKEDLDY